MFCHLLVVPNKAINILILHNYILFALQTLSFIKLNMLSLLILYRQILRPDWVDKLSILKGSLNCNYLTISVVKYMDVALMRNIQLTKECSCGRVVGQVLLVWAPERELALLDPCWVLIVISSLPRQQSLECRWCWHSCHLCSCQ